MTRVVFRYLALIVFVTMVLLSVPRGALATPYEVRLPPGAELLGRSIDGDALTLVLRSEQDAVTLERYEAGERRWSVPLAFTPFGNPRVSGGGSVFVASYACEACPPGPLQVVSDSGQTWTPEGTVDSVEVAELADRVLVSGLIEGRHLLRVYSGAGRVMGEIEMPSEPARHLDLAATGDAVLVVEGDVGEPGHAVRLYDFSKKSWERQVLPNDEVVGWAAAFDRETVVSWGEWGEGSLRLHRFGAGERASDTRRGWSRSFEGRPYYPVDQAAEAGLILATDGGGVYEVLNTDGEILWRLEPKQETRRIAGWLGISEADAEDAVRHLRVGLVGDGGITLSDSERGLTHLLRWSGDGRYQGAPSVLTLDAESTKLDSSGRYAAESSANGVRYGPLEDWQ